MASFTDCLADMVDHLDQCPEEPLPYKKAFSAYGWNGKIWITAYEPEDAGYRVSYYLPEHQTRSVKYIRTADPYFSNPDPYFSNGEDIVAY